MAQPLAGELRGAACGTIVEFIGLPGSGKSTIAHALAELLSARGFVVSEPTWRNDHASRPAVRALRKASLAAAASVRGPRRAGDLLRSLVQSRQPTRRELLQLAINALYLAETATQCARSEGIHVFDQGVLQQLWSVLYRAGDSNDAERYYAGQLAGRAAATWVVMIDTPLGAVQRRLLARTGGASRFERHLLATGPQAVLDRAMFAQRRVEALANALHAAGAARVMRVSGAGDLPIRHAARAVADWVTS